MILMVSVGGLTVSLGTPSVPLADSTLLSLALIIDELSRFLYTC